MKTVCGYSASDELLDKHRLKAFIAIKENSKIHLVDSETRLPVTTVRIQNYLAELRKTSPDAPSLQIAADLLAVAIDAPANVNQYDEPTRRYVLGNAAATEVLRG